MEQICWQEEVQGSLWQWLVWNRNSRQGCWSDTPGMMRQTGKNGRNWNFLSGLT